MATIAESQKHIRIVDQSDHHWETVAAYKGSDVTDKEDACRIEKAERTAEEQSNRKKRKTIAAQRARRLPQLAMSQQQFQTSAANQIGPGREEFAPSRPVGPCFSCYQMGHLKASCPKLAKPTYPFRVREYIDVVVSRERECMSCGKSKNYCVCACDINHVTNIVQVELTPVVSHVCHPDKVGVCQDVAPVSKDAGIEGSNVVSQRENSSDPMHDAVSIKGVEADPTAGKMKGALSLSLSKPINMVGQINLAGCKDTNTSGTTVIDTEGISGNERECDEGGLGRLEYEECGGPLIDPGTAMFWEVEQEESQITDVQGKLKLLGRQIEASSMDY